MSNREVREEWSAALERTGAAQMLLEGGYYNDSASRSYYAMHAAANASLRFHQVTATTHKGVQLMFKEHCTGEGKLDEEYAADLSKGQSIRMVGDYKSGKPVTEIEARKAFERAKRFIRATRRYLIKRGVPGEDLPELTNRAADRNDTEQSVHDQMDDAEDLQSRTRKAMPAHTGPMMRELADAPLEPDGGEESRKANERHATRDALAKRIRKAIETTRIPKKTPPKLPGE